MNPRLLGLPALAAALVGVVLVIQVAYGGGTFEPLATADPCAPRAVTSQSDGIDALTEELVLRALDDAACSLGTSREAFTLELAQPSTRTDAEVEALRQGLLDAVAEMKADGTLPPASDLVDDALDQADLNPIVESLIRAVPDSVIDAALQTDDVLTRAIEDLDMEALMANLSDPDELNAQVEAAVTQAVRDSLVARLRSLV
ncbi:hypothetical protein [Nocardioides mangrovi]|uniref:DUF305 domain-containing protein n=1 Tax=Nocardioides mangrovi TaxID=2874580 RepID=A0ABS7UCX5_9ACTN|nr:hypothetical protein [Nocardioides mangrovi]MBZ5738858.1 hypothetical protein [Nocardioides mangrovi]